MAMKLTPAQARALGLAEPNRPGRKRARPSHEPAPIFEQHCAEAGLPSPVAEIAFAPPRRWKFDWCWPEPLLALEVQGGLFTQGRHVRGPALLAEYAKLTEAAIRGWRVLLVTPAQFACGEVIALARRALLPASR